MMTMMMTMVKMLMMMTNFYLSTTAGASHDAKAKTPYTMPLLDLFIFSRVVMSRSIMIYIVINKKNGV